MSTNWETDVPAFRTAEPMVGYSQTAIYTATDQMDPTTRCPARDDLIHWGCAWAKGHDGPHIPISDDLASQGFGIIDRRPR